MIKYVGKRGDKQVIGFGITERNVSLLREGLPIVINGDEMGLIGMEFIISYGKNEEAIANEMRESGLLK